MDGVAPGMVVEGDRFRVYSKTWTEGASGVVFIDDDTGDANPPLAYEGIVQTGGFIEITPDPLDLPAIGTYWFVSAADDLDGTARSVWLNALQVELAGDAGSPLVVANEEDVSCGGAGTECAHPILPGQTWQGAWGHTGDVDYFHVAAGAGTRIRVTLDYVDGTQGIGGDARDPDPEIFVVEPGGVYSLDTYADDRSPADPNATLEWTTRKSGLHHIAASARQGTSRYLVRLETIAESPGTQFELVPYESPSYLVLSDQPTADVRMYVLDPFGAPTSGARVTWTLDEGSAQMGQQTLSSWTGVVSNNVTLTGPDSVYATPTIDLPSIPTSKSAVREPVATWVQNPILGLVERRGLAIVSDRRIGDLSKEAIARLRALRAQATDPVAAAPASEAGATMKGAAGCWQPGISVGLVQLPPGYAGIVGVDFKLRDGQGDLIERLEDVEVLSDAGLITVEAELELAQPAGSSCAAGQLPLVDLPVQIEVLSGARRAEDRGQLSIDGSQYCEAISFSLSDGPVAFQYLTGTKAVFVRSVDGAVDPYQYATMELLRASMVLPVIIDIQSAPGACAPPSPTIRAMVSDTKLEVAPEPAPPADPVDTGVAAIEYWGIDGASATWYPIDRLIDYPFMFDGPDRYSYLAGPSFLLRDAYSNVNVEFGAVPGRTLADQALIDFAVDHQPPISFRVAHPFGADWYQVRAIASDLIQPGQYPNTLRIHPEGTVLAADLTMTMLGSDTPLVMWKCLGSNDLSACAQSLLAGGMPLAEPGEPVLTPIPTSGSSAARELVTFRIHPVQSDQQGEQAPSHPPLTVDSRVYVSGPSPSPSEVRFYGPDDGPALAGMPIEAHDVVLRVSSVSYPGGGGDVQTAPLRDGRPSEAAFNPVQSTTGAFAAAPFTAAAVSVLEAPKEPGYYHVFAEPQGVGWQQHTGWHFQQGFTFLVTGLHLLESDYTDAEHYQGIDEQKTLLIEYISSSLDSPPGNLWLRYENALGEVRPLAVGAFASGSCGGASCSWIKRLVVRPELSKVDPACQDGACLFLEAPPVPFRLELGQLAAGGDPSAGLTVVHDVVYGHGAVHEIPLGEHRRLTYALHRAPPADPVVSTSPVDQPMVIEWQDAWATTPPTEWLSLVVDPGSQGQTLGYSFQNNLVTLHPATGEGWDSYCFRNIKETDTDVGYVRAFHASGDVEHESQTNYDFLAGMHSTGYGPERTTMLLSSTAHPGEAATALLRGVLPDHIQSDLCRQANAGNEDRNCGTTVIDDYTNVLFSIDDVILYFADRNGFPPDVLKAHIFQESPGTSEPNQVMFYTNMYRYEPYTWDFKEYSGCAGSYQIQGTRCSDGAAGLFRKLSVLPFCLYATGGPILDCESDGLGTDDPAHFAAGLTLTATIPAGTPRDGFELDLSTMTGAPGNFPMQAARARLYAVPLTQSPYCIDQRDAACRVDPSPSYTRYGITVSLGAADWNQVATNTHRMLVAQRDAPHSARPLGPDEFRVYYSSGQEQVIDLGSVPAGDLTVRARPNLITEIGPGLKPLPPGVASAGAFLTDSTRDSVGFGLQFNEGSSISSWVHANWTKGADQGFLRVLEGDAGQSQNWFLLDVDGQDLYDPQYESATAQFLLAGSFGLMQVGAAIWDYNEPYGGLLRSEYDLEAPGHHILDFVMKSWTSIRAGSVLDGYHLYAPLYQHLQTACPEECMREILRDTLYEAIRDYNSGHDTYGTEVFDRLPLVSPTPDTWR